MLRTRLLASLSLLLIAASARAAEPVDTSGLWTDLQGQPGAAGRSLRLDVAALRQYLRAAPMEWAAGMGAPLALPLPGAGFARFDVVESPVLDAALQRRFPDIRTYRGQGRDDRGATVRLDVTPRGFHAMILSAAGTTMIDPIEEGDTARYVVRTKREQRPDERFRCLTDEPAGPPARAVPTTGALPFGDTLRTFRFALAADGEYTARVCLPELPGIPCALAAMTTGVNRLNEIFEREVAVRLLLIAQEPLIIYTDPDTDPYTDGQPAVMREENQANLDAVIGSPNYDIGHVFGTGGGGIAVIGGVCINPQKGRAATGLGDPTGDPFYVDYVSHEIGHHLGANHSFNGTTEFCGPNRWPPSAREPGSGSTIMSYSGLCLLEDVQFYSDDYYHVGSQIEISNFLDAIGVVCSTNIPTGNTIPTVSAGPDLALPAATPFTLTATGSDPDGDALTFAWEEMDLGAPGPPNTDDGTRPIFRSYSPDPSPSRTFPQLQYVLNWDNVPPEVPVSESLPVTTRSMEFRATIRDNRSGGGGVASDLMVVNVQSAAGPFKVTAPDTGVTWTVGTSQLVAWNVANTTAPPVSCAAVDIRLSADGGASFPTVLAAATPNDGTETITVPDTPTDTARLKVACASVPFFDISNMNFTIAAVPVELQAFTVE
jgi:reprolysin-like metallo-peptidase family M12B